ncbi:GPI-anchored wall transfer protein 1 [Cladophialophora carrionii]|uniref:GPI-anchored wall transfer protein n=1 Tax=Cladophialophora carrionii TaxID=86049 RepID=A0A1C1CNT7_9EURO|nr:GPI-anchored wall transfer protein 1 [Cladophialophora carrionii]
MSKDPAAHYKIRKEAFVSNLSGSSLTEINLVTLVAASAVFLWTALQARHSFFTPYTPVALVADFLINVCAILFAITLYSSAPLALTIFLVTPGILLLSLGARPGRGNPVNGPATRPKRPTAGQPGPRSAASVAAPSRTASQTPTLVVRPFLTHYRGTMLVVTCLAILAVDFPIFPRRYAKVETWGTSLMDLGVGSFVFSAGVVSARAIVRSDDEASHSQSGLARRKNSNSNNNFAARFVKALRHAVPLFVLGLIRLYSVKGLDYAEHVTEYGVHWNFFFTLALLPPFVEISDTATRRVFKSYEVFALVLTVTYELVLNNTTLLSYILISPRGPDLLSKNREGVFSFVGYLAIFLFGRGVGVPLVQFNGQGPQNSIDPNPRQHIPEIDVGIENTRRERISILRSLIVRSIVYATLYALSTNLHTFNLSVSRRLANLPYVLWVVAFNTAQLFLFGLVEAVGPSFSYTQPTLRDPDTDSDENKDARRKGNLVEAARTRTPTSTAATATATSTILRVFNGNGLATFLVANLLTGLVNLSLNTLDMSPAKAMALLIGYALIVTAVALGLDMSGVKIKL